MKTIKLEKTEVEFPTIVKIEDDYYLVSKKYFPETQTEKGNEKHIAINLTNGEWFDWEDAIPNFEPQIETFKKGTKFEIEI